MPDNEPAKERQASDDANEAARNSQVDTDAAALGVLGEDQRDPLPGDADEAVPDSTPHQGSSVSAEQPAGTPEPEVGHPAESGHDRRRRHAHRNRLYLYAVFSAVLLIAIVALIIANTRTVTVSWVFGSTHQPLVWVVLAAAVLGWLLGILTSILFRFRTRAPRGSTRQRGDVTVG